MPPTPALIATNLTKHFGDIVAVNQLSFEAPRGKILGLLGANGAGKSTIIQMLLGLTRPTGGRVDIFGKPLFQNRTSLLQRMNFASAYASLPGNLTVEQNLKTFGRIYGVQNLRERIQELLELFEIPQLLKSVTGHLSSGEATRVALAKSLLNQPELLLLDEPTASLDPDIADKVRQTIRRLQSETDMTIIYTSHNMRDIEEICHEVLFIHSGQVRAQGTPQQLLTEFQQSSMEEVFIHLARGGENHRRTP